MNRRAILFVCAAIAALALILCAWQDAAAAVRAWLYAFVLVSTIPIGSLALLLVHGISGGRWGQDFAPVLVPAARTMPLLIVVFLPVIVFRPMIYDWQTLGLPHDVMHYYLNPPFFDARTLIGLGVWSVLAWTDAWRNTLFAALGIVAHLILLTVLPADWILTIQPGSVSAGFGFGFGIEQMFAALAFTAVLAPQQPARANRDLAGLSMTTLLGTVYFLYMQFVITWYGNIPAKVHWYDVRTGNGWSVVMLLAFAIGAVVPFLAILNPYVRREPSAMRFVGLFILTGICLHMAWLTLPVFGTMAIAPAAAAAILLAAGLGALASFLPLRGGVHGA